MATFVTTSDRLRQTGLLAVGVGVAWAMQILLGGDASGLASMMWVLGAAIIAGGGTGLVCVSEAAVNVRASALIET